jgi:hypothetical protein
MGYDKIRSFECNNWTLEVTALKNPILWHCTLSLRDRVKNISRSFNTKESACKSFDMLLEVCLVI